MPSLQLKFGLALALAAVACMPVPAQPVRADQPDTAVDAARRARLLEGTIGALNRSYVFPEVAKKMEAALRTKDQAGGYAALESGAAFARTLTEDLRAVSQDRHLRVLYSFDPLPPDRDPTAAPSADEQRRERDFLRSINYGFDKVERLPGNIGYIELRSFTSPELAGATASAAMTFVADTDALIVDLRRNGGGDPAMVAYLSSYLFDKRTHLNDLYWRERNRTDEFWTRDDVPGKRFGQAKPVYVLTSKRTFSGAEEFSYNLKNLKRATLVGETTGGGAHPGGPRRIDDHFAVWVPGGRAISPITKTNWEGTGVAPDVEAPAERALDLAQALALKALLARAEGPQKAALQRRLDELDAGAAARPAAQKP
jgi:hypothetical protein